MKRDFIKDFLLDQIAAVIAFLGAMLLVWGFYSMISEKRLEIQYPLCIILFVLLIFMGVRLMDYYRLYQVFNQSATGVRNQAQQHSKMSERVVKELQQLHQYYLDKLAYTESLSKKERRFLSLWIHNMKTPITVTDVLLQRMEQEEMDGQIALQTLKEENRKLFLNLESVLNMIRLEEFAKDYTPEPIDLLAEVKDIINKNKSQFIYQQVFPKISTSLSSTTILSDRKWNELLISQLISNAIKYSKKDEENGQKIYFLIDKKEDHIVLTIRDEGIGIPEHDLPKVFEPFFTGENGRKGYASSGIGLYFCKEVCRLLGHKIEISSKEGEGCSVSVSYLAKL